MSRQRLYGWLIIVIAAAAMAFGGLWWRERSRVMPYQDAAACWGVLRDQGVACAGVRVVVTSHPKAAVVGEVSSVAERARLDARLTEALGAEGRGRVMFHVRVQADAE